MMTTILLLAALPTWAVALIVAGAVLMVGALVYIVYRWGKKSTATKIALSGAAAIFSVLESFFKDDPDKLDAHDFLAASEDIAALCLVTIGEAEAGKQIDELKDDMKASMRKILDSFPGMAEKVSDDLIARAVDAFFVLIHNIPKVNDIVKK